MRSWPTSSARSPRSDRVVTRPTICAVPKLSVDSFDGVEVSVEGTFRDQDTGEEQPGSFVGECGPGSRF